MALTLWTGICSSECQRWTVRTPRSKYAAISFYELKGTTFRLGVWVMAALASMFHSTRFLTVHPFCRFDRKIAASQKGAGA